MKHILKFRTMSNQIQTRFKQKLAECFVSREMLRFGCYLTKYTGEMKFSNRQM